MTRFAGVRTRSSREVLPPCNKGKRSTALTPSLLSSLTGSRYVDCLYPDLSVGE